MDAAALAFALALEALDVPAWWRGYLVTRLIHPALHPVSLVYRAASPLAKPGGVGRGLAVLAAGLAVGLAPALLAHWAKPHLGLLGPLVEGYLLKLSFGVAHIVYPCGRDADLRRVAQQFVRRDLSSASGGHVRSACLEAAAESLVDSYVSPLMWYILLGLPGAWLQRAVNTLDGLVGFPRFGKAGAPAAYLDTALNYIPARLAALCILAVSNGWRPPLLAHRRRMASRNAGWPIAALASALGVVLEKPGSYSVGEGGLPTPLDVARGLSAVARAAAAFVLLTSPALLPPPAWSSSV
ncbi:CobD/CbiB family cobalamin biosynthesis protein [Pyrobaculum neutrophilum]|uniref:Probable cobalamin biosynthesis protein CobD n=1 Tax=Pyrobaculum neutrophilum (strain DSM 2338 / JCM 9278 / NBRC 100436 / V24Sta) TaxID=444157 RepID=B1YBA3_PYRNV|nr:CobD/CbiB family cobalamin biosynthesis protein [Pyrobaculum neutrophilum]ACB39234.1 cobalamin biosynthesis protein CbiB [Pyrobaculum neutrophilum V24Sta]